MLDTDAENFALFFERSNSRGIQLDFIDILAGELYSGFNLREEASKLVEDTKLKGERVLQEILVRSIALNPQQDQICADVITKGCTLFR
jgi:hypothetical protein